jgi:hypothetical protein
LRTFSWVAGESQIRNEPGSLSGENRQKSKEIDHPENKMRTNKISIKKPTRKTLPSKHQQRAFIIIVAILFVLTAVVTCVLVDPVAVATQIGHCLHQHFDYVVEVSVIGIIATLKSWIEGRH